MELIQSVREIWYEELQSLLEVVSNLIQNISDRDGVSTFEEINELYSMREAVSSCISRIDGVMQNL